MFKDIANDFHISYLWNGYYPGWGLDRYDWILVTIMLITVIIVNIIREKGVDIPDALLQKPIYVRWALVLSLLMIITIFGCYGPGFEEVDLIYAGF